MRSSSKQRVTAEKKHFDCSNFERDIIVFTIFEKKKGSDIIQKDRHEQIVSLFFYSA